MSDKYELQSLIDESFNVKAQMPDVLDFNYKALDNFEIVMGVTNNAPCQGIMINNVDINEVFNWVKTLPIIKSNLYSRKVYSGYPLNPFMNNWYFWLSNDLAIYAQNDLIKVFHTHQSINKAFRLVDLLKNRFLLNGYPNRIIFYDDKKNRNKPVFLKNNPIDIKKDFDESLKDINKTILKSLKNKETKGIIVLASNNSKHTTDYIKYLTRNINRRFVYISHWAAQFFEYCDYDFDSSLNSDIFIVENIDEYFKYKDVYDQSIAKYVQNLLKCKLTKPYNVPLIVTINGSFDDFPKLKDLNSKHIIAKYEFKDKPIPTP